MGVSQEVVDGLVRANNFLDDRLIEITMRQQRVPRAVAQKLVEDEVRCAVATRLAGRKCYDAGMA
jgi:hypothetical protein